jgi:hypothetical protein
MRPPFQPSPLKCSVVSIGYSLKSTSFNEQASHVFQGPRLASGRRFLSSAFKACLWFIHSFPSVEVCRVPVFGAAPPTVRGSKLKTKASSLVGRRSSGLEKLVSMFWGNGADSSGLREFTLLES